MDKKQNTILDKILDANNLPDPSIFIQHRNLNEFKYFKIEKINPTHRIILYGSLKNGNKKKETSKSLIKAGEIIIVIGAIGIDFKLLYSNINLVSLVFSMFSLNVFLFYVFGNVNILRRAYDSWNRRFHGRWKNHLHG